MLVTTHMEQNTYVCSIHRCKFSQAQTARNSSWVTIYEVSAPDAQSILVTGLVPFTTYRLRLIATNVVGSSPPSEPCKEFQTIQAPPQHPPRNVTVRAVSANNLRVRWIVSHCTRKTKTFYLEIPYDFKLITIFCNYFSPCNKANGMVILRVTT